MLIYTETKPFVYIEPTVISYLVADPSHNPQLAFWQAESRRFWNEYQKQVEFVVSGAVLDEISQGNPIQARKRMDAVAHLPSLVLSSQARALAQQLLTARAVPENSEADAKHIAIAIVHGVDYLVSWNHKHLVNENQLRQINRVVAAAGFRPVTICTPTTFMEELVMKEMSGKCYLPGFDPETYTDPVLEECYRIKRELSEELRNVEDYYEYAVAQKKKWEKAGFKYLPLPPHLTPICPEKD